MVERERGERERENLKWRSSIRADFPRLEPSPLPPLEAFAAWVQFEPLLHRLGCFIVYSLVCQVLHHCFFAKLLFSSSLLISTLFFSLLLLLLLSSSLSILHCFFSQHLYLLLSSVLKSEFLCGTRENSSSKVSTVKSSLKNSRYQFPKQFENDTKAAFELTSN